MRQNFFAYGPFAQDQVHHGKIAELIVSSKPGFVRANVYRLRCGYPVLQPMETGDLVEGLLCELEIPDSYWAIMDVLVGVSETHSPFVRGAVPVLQDSFSKVLALTYCLNPEKKDQLSQAIAQGDWQKNMAKNPPILNQLEDKHLDYIKKLAKARGREIVPYKLDVYRSLLSMELIKDKGRRPALTSLGQELCLFLQ